MKESTLILLCAAALSQGVIAASESIRQCNCDPSEAQKVCENAFDNHNDVFVAHEFCDMFYKCSNGKPYPIKCPNKLLYDPVKEICDWPNLVECGDRTISDGNDDASVDDDCDGTNNLDTTTTSPEGDNNSENTSPPATCNCDPNEAPSICAAENSNGILVAHENCNQFYKCNWGLPVQMSCPRYLLYNPYIERCDFPNNVECGDRVIPEPENDGNNEEDNNNGGNENDASDNDGTCNCNPEEAPTICGNVNSDGVLVAHQNCNNFYKCVHGKPVTLSCPPNTLFNPYLRVCDWPKNVECGDRVIPDSDTDSDDDGIGGNGDGENDNDDNDNDVTCNCNPEEAPSICADPDSDGSLVAHQNCNTFYQCVHGKPLALPCPPNTLYNPYLRVCDWPSKVECGDRVIPDQDNDIDNEEDDNSNDSNDSDTDENNSDTCNCNPDEAQSICAGVDSEGTLIAHQHCNKFYKCVHREPLAMPCPPNTLYNPYLRVCDWPNKVKCGDRIIVKPDHDDSSSDSSDSSSSDDDSSDSSSSDSDSSSNSSDNDSSSKSSHEDNSSNSSDFDDDLGSDNEGNVDDNSGTCNCNPEEADLICAGENSNDMLIAHKNCNQFYQCSNGIPKGLKCPKDLLYNPYKEICDWPKNVQCGDRIIPTPGDNENISNEDNDNDSENNDTCNCNPEEAPAICAGKESDSVLIAHEFCNQFYICANSVPIALACPPHTLYNPYKAACDWAGKVQCGDRLIPDPKDDNDGNDNNDSSNESDDNDNSNTIHDNPSQAPAICGEIDSDGVLVAHENCNQFYQCSGSVPIAMSCASDLMFNILTGECDWARNVNCGDRIKPDNDCACNPRNAPALCARQNSNGKLIAHENCNQFYVCVEGNPVPRYCAPTLVYNIDKEVCDWPRNVNCGSRLNTYSYSSHNKHLASRQTLNN